MVTISSQAVTSSLVMHVWGVTGLRPKSLAAMCQAHGHNHVLHYHYAGAGTRTKSCGLAAVTLKEGTDLTAVCKAMDGKVRGWERSLVREQHMGRCVFRHSGPIPAAPGQGLSGCTWVLAIANPAQHTTDNECYVAWAARAKQALTLWPGPQACFGRPMIVRADKFCNDDLAYVPSRAAA